MTKEELVLLRCAYWLSLQTGYGEVVGQQTVTVRVPAQKVLDERVLQALMEQSSRGGIQCK